MKITYNLLAILLLSTGVFQNTNADELNVGKSTATPEEIINHFTSSPASNPGAVDTDSQDAGDDISGELSGKKNRTLILKPANNAVNQKNAKTAKSGKPAIIDFAKKPTEEVAISMMVLFDYNSSYLNDKAKEQLAPIAQALLSPQMKGMRFRIEGHTDIVGSDDFNVNLSLRRAEAVKDYLTHVYGVDSAMIEVEGKGKFGLADPSDPTSEINRRVRLIKLGG